jgi:pimeloyl-ACP methyl ester carboxylesterase
MPTVDFTLNSGDCVTLNYVQMNPSAVKTLFFLHGLGTTHECWVQQLDFFSVKDYRVVAIDLPGFGSSLIHQGKFGLELTTECVLQLLRYLGIQRTTLIGHSMGGPITIHSCFRYPQYFESCVLISTFSHLRPTSFSAALALAKRFLWANFQDATHQAEFIAQRTFPEASEGGLREAFVKQILSTNKDVYRNAVNLMARINLKKEAKNLTMPAFIITGMQDRTIAPQLQHELFMQIPNALELTLKDGRHGMIVNQAGIINRAIESFIQPDQEQIMKKTP